jgi:hypothetical protein
VYAPESRTIPTPLLLYNQFGEMFFRQVLKGINFNTELILRRVLLENGEELYLQKSVLKIALYAFRDMLYFFRACNQETNNEKQPWEFPLSPPKNSVKIYFID